MLSVLIETHDSEDDLPRTLASLVGGAVEGLVREVIVCDLGSTDHTHKVSDIAGCTWLGQGGVATGARQAKGEWLLFLEPGATLAEGWMESVAQHCARATIAATFTNRERTPFLARIRRSNRALTSGLLIRKGQAISLAKNARDAEGIARGLATKQLTAGIYPAQKK